ATVIVTVAVFESKAPSFALKVKLASPVKLDAGVKTNAPVEELVIVTTPCAAFGGGTMLYVRLVLSTSVAARVPVAVMPCGVARVPFVATGASFTAVMLIEIVATFESTIPSLALNVKLAEPLKFGAGVKL